MSRRSIPLSLTLLLLLTSCSTGQGAGTEWSTVHTSADWWMSVSAPSPTEQWIVGGTPDGGRILRYDGATVTEVDHGAEVGLLNWVHGFDSGELIVVGQAGAVLRNDGAGWRFEPAPTDQDLWGVWGSATTDVWAVGGDATVLHDTGSGFEPVPLPDMERSGVRIFFKVWGSSADDVYIVGQRGAVLHWNGNALEELDVGVTEDLIGIWGTGPDRIVTVGGRRQGAAALWDGDTWRALELDVFPGLNGVWMDSDVVHIVGNDGAAGEIDFSTGEVSKFTIDTPVSLHSVTGVGGSLTAVGGDFSTGDQGPFLGQVVGGTLPVEAALTR